ncbi:ParB N-terminal domain-containing protein [uncultured Ruegeria sp.]|uniref:ParB N-terminal domain-containing protein n=1 Tax=uncultured Ruegeria sp. TaxID=259304 RepID=UPI00260764F8|nr:ParB N-terminal domain-containing protein [uncultured Ruegeria sp.]
MADKVIQSQISQIKPYANNNRAHAAKNIDKLKASVAQFGFVTPILLDGSRRLFLRTTAIPNATFWPLAGCRRTIRVQVSGKN